MLLFSGSSFKKLISKVLPGYLKFSLSFVMRAFWAVTVSEATSNYSRQLREETFSKNSVNNFRDQFRSKKKIKNNLIMKTF